MFQIRTPPKLSLFLWPKVVVRYSENALLVKPKPIYNCAIEFDNAFESNKIINSSILNP